jgi:hypothetical protein
MGACPPPATLSQIAELLRVGWRSQLVPVAAAPPMMAQPLEPHHPFTHSRCGQPSRLHAITAATDCASDRVPNFAPIDLI